MDNSKNTLADLFVDYLNNLSVKYVFGVPGGGIEPLYDALARSQRRGRVVPVIARHESGAAFMADGYYHSSGKLGVCCATTGPGSTNLLTGVASAFVNHTPLLVITAQTNLADFGRQGLQESSCTGVNVIGMFEHCTHYNTLVSHPDQFEHKLLSALIAAFQMMGPVHLSVPRDILKYPIGSDKPKFNAKEIIHRSRLVDFQAIDVCVELIKESKNGVILLGESACSVREEIMHLAKIKGMKILTTPQGRGLMSFDCPDYYGSVGFAGHSSAASVLSSTMPDLILCIGSNLGELASDGWNPDILTANLIHIDSDTIHFRSSPMARLQVSGALDAIFPLLLQRLDTDPAVVNVNGSQQVPVKHVILDPIYENETAFEAISPANIIRALPQFLPKNSRYFADSGASLAWAIHYLDPYYEPAEKEMMFRNCFDFGAMGWAIGNAVGAALADPTRPAVCITGDGSMLMNGQEITVAIQHKLPVIFVVLNDSALGMVKHGQRLAGAEQVGTELPLVNFVTMASALGVRGISIGCVDDLSELSLLEIIQLDGPLILEAYIDQEAVPPINSRIKQLTR